MKLISKLVLLPVMAAASLRGRSGRGLSNSGDHRRFDHGTTSPMRKGKKGKKNGEVSPTGAPRSPRTDKPSSHASGSIFDLRVKEESNTFCDTGPDALTAALSAISQGQPVPRFCIPNQATAGKERCYYLFVPKCVSGDIPLVVNMHGGRSCPQFSVFYDQWAQVAQRHCFALAYPIGITDPAVSDYPCFQFPGGLKDSSCCCARENKRLKANEVQDDDKVIRDMIHDIILAERIQDLSNHTAEVDSTRLYMTGHSNGCIGSLAMGAIHSDLVAAVCCHSGSWFTPMPPTYNPVPTWIAEGLEDTALPYQWVEETVQARVKAHNCSAVVDTEVGTEGDFITSYFDCMGDANITLLTLAKSDHLPFLNIGVPPLGLDTTEMAYQFCSGFRKDSVPDSLRF